MQDMIQCERCHCWSPADLGYCRWCQSADRCDADWGSATASQRCQREAGHYGVHVDARGREFGYVPNHDDSWGMAEDVSMALAAHTADAISKILGA